MEQIDIFPKIETVEDVLSKFKYTQDDKIKNLTTTEINKLLKLKNSSKKDLFSMKNVYFMYDALSLISLLGFKQTFDYLKKNSEKIDETEIIKNSEPFVKAKERFYLDLVSEIRNSVEVEGIYNCPKCGSKNTTTYSRQLRSSDEPPTEISNCRSCGYGWRG